MTIYDSTVGFFAQRTSMHGVKSAYEASNRPCRCLWGGITLCMTVMAFNYGWGICYKYLVKQESITRLSYVDYGGLALPVLTICPTRNPFILQRLQGMLVQLDVSVGCHVCFVCSPWNASAAPPRLAPGAAPARPDLPWG
ncbi:uncharacterized protein LOC122388183 [Amphibalanus amphitrite]|uniref:uncharacterized protein LOC122388183 n=1 Tax=Amphibalanus amphitrite TaxID=1232801 RepID=UPI001C92AF7A|nr:uncharacterized protein LOC122388183 [Amphibalanus amphitrite]